jgi:hypothetical protein
VVNTPRLETTVQKGEPFGEYKVIPFPACNILMFPVVLISNAGVGEPDVEEAPKVIPLFSLLISVLLPPVPL